MKIVKLELLDGARRAKGLTVIIDVFRAFSLSCYAIAGGANRIFPVDSIEKALIMKREDPRLIAIGERYERMYPGFDFGNSPTHIENIDLRGKSIVHTTSSGTQGIALAHNADEIITGSFVNAMAIVRYIQKKNPSEVSLVAMGYEGLRSTQEDSFCATYIENALLGENSNFEEMVSALKIGDGARLLDPANHEFSPARDFDLCLDLNRFNFVLKVNQEFDPYFLERIDC